jgi:hypothetical protein
MIVGRNLIAGPEQGRAAVESYTQTKSSYIYAGPAT